MKQLDLSELSPQEKNERLAAGVTQYGLGTRSYNRSSEKREMDRQRAEATANYVSSVVIVGPVCGCRSFQFPHDPEAHKSLPRGDLDWRTPEERRGSRTWEDPVK
jgi:hypothetical protein